MKAIIVIDMPNSCTECPMFSGTYNDMYCQGEQNRGINYPYPSSFRQKWCSLKEIPEKHNNIRTGDEYYYGYDIGWNNCIDTILQEKIINED